jgi:hypothetical protein
MNILHEFPSKSIEFLFGWGTKLLVGSPFNVDFEQRMLGPGGP